MLGRGQQDDAAGLAHREGGLGVAAEEEALDPDERRAVDLDQLADRLVDRVQPIAASDRSGEVTTQP